MGSFLHFRLIRCDFSLYSKGMVSEELMVGSLHQVPSNPKEIIGGAVGRETTLDVS